MDLHNRKQLAISFVAGIVISLVGLALAGKVEGWHFVLALELLPGLLVEPTLKRFGYKPFQKLSVPIT